MSEVKTVPIHPVVFAESMADKIKSLSPEFFTGGKLFEGFYEFGATYNECVRLNKEGEETSLVVPSSTGSGKTVSAKLYLKQIAKLGYSGMLVVSEIDVGMEAVQEIGEDVAGIYYRGEDSVDIEDLPQILIISHAMFIKRSDSGKDVDLLRNYGGRQRDCIIIDERIDLIKRVSFSTSELPDLIAILKRDSELESFVELLEGLNRDIWGKNENVNSAVSNKNGKPYKELAQRIYEVGEGIELGRYDLRRNIRSKNKSTDREDAAELLARIGFTVEKSGWNQTKEGKYVVVHREEDLSGAFGSAAVLDATALVNPEYEMRANNGKDMKIFSKNDSRDYCSVNLNVCEAKELKQSKTELYNIPKNTKTIDVICDEYLSIIGDIAKPDDKLLVVTYRDLASIFESRSPYPNVKFIYWGSADARGSNEFSDFNKAMAIGWFRRPQHVYVGAVMAINKIQDYASLTGSVWSDANYLKDRLIADDMIQFFNRVRCRIAIDKNGNCEPVELYMFSGGNERIKDIITASVSEEMKNISITGWHPKLSGKIKRKPKKADQRAETVIRYLRGQMDKHSEILASIVREDLGISSQQFTQVMKSEYFESMLIEESIDIVGAGGKRNPMRFILPQKDGNNRLNNSVLSSNLISDGLTI